MDSSIAADPRFKLAARELGIAWTAVVGSCFLVWLAAYERRSKRFRKIEADIAAEVDGFANALVSVGLATELDADTIEIHGVEKRITFLDSQKQRAAKGGKQSGKSRRVKSEANASANGAANALAPLEPNASSTAQAYPLTPAPDLSPSPDLALAPNTRARARNEPGAAQRLWDLQERLRAELGLPSMPASPGRLGMVQQLLGQYTEAQLEHVLRVCARIARENPRERDWFDGRRNWAPAVIEQRLGQSADPTPAPKRRAGEVGSAAPTPREEFGDGPQEIPR
jgi:hypothetical protein